MFAVISVVTFKEKIFNYVIKDNNNYQVKLYQYDNENYFNGLKNYLEPYEDAKIPSVNVADFIPVLAYHNFVDDNHFNGDKYTVPMIDFEKQLKYLYDNGYHTITVNELYNWINKRIILDNKSFMITIDDANISSYYLALPLIKKYNFDAIVFVITNRIGKVTYNYKSNISAFYGEDCIKDIHTNYPKIVLGSHSNSLHGTIHGDNPMNVLSYDEIYNDLKLSKEILKTNVFAYPFGMYNDKYEKAVIKSGFKLAFTFKPSGVVRQDISVYEVPRLNINSQVSFNLFKNYIENK